MQVINAQLYIEIIRLLCPHLKDMAKRTKNEIDDAVVDFICRIVNAAAVDTKK